MKFVEIACQVFADQNSVEGAVRCCFLDPAGSQAYSAALAAAALGCCGQSKVGDLGRKDQHFLSQASSHSYAAAPLGVRVANPTRIYLPASLTPYSYPLSDRPHIS
jgi:hypothetical protein